MTRHYLVTENHDNAKQMLEDAILSKDNIYWTSNIADISVKHGEEAVRIFMNEIAQIAIKTGDEVIIISGNNTIPENHIIISVLQKRFMETIKLEVFTENIMQAVEIPWAERCSIKRDPRDKYYSGTSFNSSSGGGCGGCGGSCSNC